MRSAISLTKSVRYRSEFILWYNSNYSKDKIDKVVLAVLGVAPVAGTVLYKYPLQLGYYSCFFITFVFSCYLANSPKTAPYRFCFWIMVVFNVQLLIIYYQSFLKDWWVG